MASLFNFRPLKLAKDLIIGSSDEDNFDSLSQEELVKKASELDIENKAMTEKIQKLKNENYLLDNSIIKKNGQNDTEYSHFLELMEKSLLNSKNVTVSNDYSIDTFKKFLYDQNIFLGTLEEDDINYLKKKGEENEFDWEKDKNDYQLKQEILKKNLKELYSNMFIVKNNKPKENIKKEKDFEDKKIDNKIKEDENRQEKTILKKDISLKLNNDNSGNKKEEQVNLYEDLLDD